MKWFQVKDANLEEVKKQSKWTDLPSDEVLEKTVKALAENGMETQIVETGEEAKKKALELIPRGAEVMTMSSQTLEAIGLISQINESGDYDAVKPKLMAMDRATQGVAMKKLGVAPEWSVGSANAVTEDGRVVVASNTGSQIPGYAYGATHVIWVVGTQKIVKNLDEAFNRINDYVLPLEAERINKVHGAPGSYVSKMLIFNQEITADRIKIIFVKEKLGF